MFGKDVNRKMTYEELQTIEKDGKLPCGFYNGIPCYSHEEYVYRCREKDLGYFGAIESDEELIKFAQKASHDWYDAGWHLSFESYYLGDYALDEPRRSLTDTEYARLRELQKEAKAVAKAKEDAREWKYVTTYHYADNSEEELWRDKYGVEKMVMVTAPHGDACY